MTPGWVSQRDFLIGLAITQAFPGPNFNCKLIFLLHSSELKFYIVAVYLGALAMRSEVTRSTHSPVLGAILAFIGIFTPGLYLAMGFQSFWHRLRRVKSVSSILKGLNAAAVGLVFCAVYRLWEAGYLRSDQGGALESGTVVIQGRSTGSSLGKEPWFVVIAAVAYCLEEGYGVETWMAILAGAVLGVAWWGIVKPAL